MYLHNNNLLHYNPSFLYIRHVCVLVRIPVCVISRVYVHYGHAYFSCLKIAMSQQSAWTPLVFRPAHPWLHKWAQMHLLFKQRGTGRENDNCVGLKLAKITCVAPCAALRRMYDRAHYMQRRILTLIPAAVLNRFPIRSSALSSPLIHLSFVDNEPFGGTWIS